MYQLEKAPTSVVFHARLECIPPPTPDRPKASGGSKDSAAKILLVSSSVLTVFAAFFVRANFVIPAPGFIV